MPESTAARAPRKVAAWVTLSLDGFAAGPGNDMRFLAEHAGHEQMMEHSEGIWRGVSTALMGRTNYEGFVGYWPPVARDPNSRPRDRDLAIWLDNVEKVVFSRTLKEATWQNARVSSDLEGEVRSLKRSEGRDILVLNSASIIRALLAAELLDELHLFLVPVILGAGLRFFPEGLPTSTWRLTGVTTLPTGALATRYARP
jgi:dihydrofolate reductase